MFSIKPRLQDITLAIAVVFLGLFFYLYATLPDILYVSDQSAASAQMEPIIDMFEREGFTVRRIPGPTLTYQVMPTIIINGKRFTGIVDIGTLRKELK